MFTFIFVVGVIVYFTFYLTLTTFPIFNTLKLLK